MRILEYIEKHDWIKSIIKYHFDKNSALNLTYHNFFHGLVVTSSAIDACDHYDLSAADKDLLIAACLFHDFNHSGGKEKDDWNVIEAKKVFVEWNAIHKKFKNDDDVLDIITATQYPYIIEGEKLSYLQAIIRDADLTQLFQPNRIQQNYLGLGVEMKADTKAVLEGTLKFIETIVPCTSWFKGMWKVKKEEVIKEVKILLSVYEN